LSAIAISSRPLYTTAGIGSGSVVAAREVGVVVAARLGMLVLREPRSPARLVAAVAIFSGLVVIAVSR